MLTCIAVVVADAERLEKLSHACKDCVVGVGKRKEVLRKAVEFLEPEHEARARWCTDSD